MNNHRIFFLPKLLITIFLTMVILNVVGAKINEKEKIVKIAGADDSSAAKEAMDKAASQTFNLKNLTVDDSHAKALQGNEGYIISFLGLLIDFLAKLAASMSMLGLIVGGVMMVFSGGNEDMMTKGKGTLTYSILGLVIVFGAYIIVTFVEGIFY